jgi:predicted O-methyltransferase YrrM
MNLYYFRRECGERIRELLGRRSVPKRYAEMYRDISAQRPRTLMEIGTHDGLNAVRMMRLTGSEASYYGFDLFEDLDETSYLREFALRPPSRRDVERHLRRCGVQVARLQSGDTRYSLARVTLPKMDFIFIDGGHSEETVASDWANCQALMHQRSVVYFDDYPRWGVGPVVDAIDRDRYDVVITKEFDEFPDIFSNGDTLVPFHMARVTLRPRSGPSGGRALR